MSSSLESGQGIGEEPLGCRGRSLPVLRGRPVNRDLSREVEVAVGGVQILGLFEIAPRRREVPAQPGDPTAHLLGVGEALAAAGRERCGVDLVGVALRGAEIAGIDGRVGARGEHDGDRGEVVEGAERGDGRFARGGGLRAAAEVG